MPYKYKNYKVTYNILNNINDKKIIDVKTTIINDVLSPDKIIYFLGLKELITMDLIKVVRYEEL